MPSSNLIASAGSLRELGIFSSLDGFQRTNCRWSCSADLQIGLLEIPADLLNDCSEIIPSFSLISSGNYGFCFELEAVCGGELVQKVLTPVGDFPPGLMPDSAKHGDAVTADIDLFKINERLDSAVLRIYLSGEAKIDSNDKWLLSAACKSEETHTLDAKVMADQLALDVPPRSQMEVAEIGHRICSPTSVAMVLEYFGITCSTEQIACEAYCPKHDLFGVWPWNIYAASRHNVTGLIGTFSSWASAAALLQRGIPLVASIRYGKGELSGAAQERKDQTPSGHLLVIRGWKRGAMLVNDPASRTLENVSREYNFDEFSSIWLGRAAVAYVFLPPQRP